jgi:hypothetical protein
MRYPEPWELTARGGTSGHKSRTTVDAMLITPRLPIESFHALEPMLGQNTLAVSGSNMAVGECHTGWWWARLLLCGVYLW